MLAALPMELANGGKYAVYPRTKTLDQVQDDTRPSWRAA
jgi:hypothetical protein